MAALEQRRADRRLAAILAADMVGYSRLMSADEVGTVGAVKRFRTGIIQPLLARFKGRLIKTTGDGFLFEFGSVFDAFDFAASVQSHPDRQLLRMGLNLGGIIVDGDDVFGDGVNVAARLEPLSPPGGLLFSNRAWEDLRRLPVAFETAGVLELKNMPGVFQAWTATEGELRAYAETLVGQGDETAGPVAVRPAAASAGRTRYARFSRRDTLIAAGGVAAVTAGALAYQGLVRRGTSPDPAELASLLDQAWQAWTQGTAEGYRQAIGLYRRATAIAPNKPDPWGFLGIIYGDHGHFWVKPAERPAEWGRAKEAGQRALALDPRNAYGRAAIAYARPHRGNWRLMESEYRLADKDQPGRWLIVYMIALLMGEVGRYREAAELFGGPNSLAPTAQQYRWYIESLWASEQLDRAEKELRAAVEIYSTNIPLWWLRFNMLLNSGRAAEALALSQDKGAVPADLSAPSLDWAVSVARAVITRAPTEVEDALSRTLAAARRGASAAKVAIGYACLLNKADAAFEIAEALYFSQGFSIPDGYSAVAGADDVTLDDRGTRLLFLPSARAMWKDHRFPALLDRLDLTAYWKASGSAPDFRTA